MISRAVVVTKHGGPDVLAVQDHDLPTVGPGQLVVEVAASGVNFIDVYKRSGVYTTTPPFVLGEEAAGRVVASEAADVPVGSVVAFAKGSTGSHATLTVVDADAAVPVPDGLDPQLAAAVMLQGMTAHYLVNSTFALQAGQTALVHAAAGGVGQLLVQLARAKGAHVVATVGSAAKAEVARSLGADHVIRYDQADGPGELAAAVREAAGGGVDVAYDGVGRATFDASLASLRVRGMLALFGGASGQVPPFDLQRLNSGGSLFVTRPTLAHYIADRAELLWRAGEVLAAVADGSLHVDVGGRYALDEAAEAYRDLEGRRTTGKLLLVP
jgi:NADPH2:quinone reductase